MSEQCKLCENHFPMGSLFRIEHPRVPALMCTHCIAIVVAFYRSQSALREVPEVLTPLSQALKSPSKSSPGKRPLGIRKPERPPTEERDTKEIVMKRPQFKMPDRKK